MEFIETATFTRTMMRLMIDEDYTAMQMALAEKPDLGKIIPRGGGIRKMRWAGSGRGKRGGLRVIYYWQVADSEIWLLIAHPKNEKDDLSADELKQLKQLVEQFNA